MQAEDWGGRSQTCNNAQQRSLFNDNDLNISKHKSHSSSTALSLDYRPHNFDTNCSKPPSLCRPGALRPMMCIRLTASHRRVNREWARELVHWKRNEWHNILFPDESRLSLHPENKRIFIWRKRGIRNTSAFAHEDVKFGGGAVMVYDGISTDGRTDLHIIRNGAQTGHRYNGEILRHCSHLCCSNWK